MSIVRMNPLFPAKPFTTVLDEIFNRSLGDFVGFDNAQTIPAVNIKETDEHFVLEMAAPGFAKADFNITLENEQLIISAEKKIEEDKKEAKWARKEFHFEKFSRRFTMPETANLNQITAAYESGVLILDIAKKEEAKVQPAKVIEIK